MGELAFIHNCTSVTSLRNRCKRGWGRGLTECIDCRLRAVKRGCSQRVDIDWSIGGKVISADQLSPRALKVPGDLVTTVAKVSPSAGLAAVVCALLRCSAGEGLVEFAL